jgi:S1-C subfamily serine protease
VRGADDVVRIVAERLRPGQRAQVKVLRQGRTLQVPVRLAVRPQNPQGR